MWIYMHIKAMYYMNEYEYDVEETYETSVVTVNNKYYEVPKEIAEAITNMNTCAELLATDLAIKKKKDPSALFLEYFNKAKETTKN